MSLLPINQAFACLIFALLLQTPTAHAEDELEPTLAARSYDIAVVNRRLKAETGIGAEQSRQWLQQRIRKVLGGGDSAPPTPSASTNRSPNLIGVSTADGQTRQLPLDEFHRGVLVAGDELFVVAPEAEFRRVQELLQTLEQFGVRQIVIQTHVFRDSVEALKQLSIHWSQVEAASQLAESAEPTVKPAATDNSPQGHTAAAIYLQRQQPAEQEQLSPPEGVTSATWTSAKSIVERTTPVLYTLLTPTEYQAVLERAKRVPTLERLMSPTVIVYNGQVATISNSVERPFVTGIKPILVGEKDSQQVEFTPSVRVYSEGTTMKFLPELFDGQRIRLNYQLDVCKVRDVETLEIPSIDGRNNFSVQMPEVASTQFRTCLELPINYTLAVSTFETDGKGKKHSVVILCRCALRDVEPPTGQP